MSHRALVVDDDDDVRQLTRRALAQEGFRCEEAADGRAALQKLACQQYDLLVVDLRMPVLNGHAVIVEVLKEERRPCIVALTAVLEPKITRDLMARGVDDVCFKPVEYRAFAAKVAALVRRRNISRPNNGARRIAATAAARDDEEPDGELAPVSAAELRRTFDQQPLIPPISPVAIRVYDLVRGGVLDTGEIAAAMAQDGSLCVQVLKLANSSAFNRSGEPIATIERAVAQIGISRVGELALTGSTVRLLADRQLSWLDTRLVWRRSIAAAAAVQLLAEDFLTASDDVGLFVAALTHLSGRLALAAMYPEHYRRIAARCRQENTTLRAGEQRYFVFDHAEAMAELAAKWNLPRKIYEVLKHVLKPYHFVRQLSEPLQSQVQLLKLSTFLGRLAVERWQSWDTVDLPPPSVFRRLRSPESALAKIRSAVEEAERMPKSDRLESGSGTDDTTLVCGALDYVSLCPLAPDPLEAILATAGVIASDGAYKRGSGSKQILVNTVGATAPELAQLEAVCRSKAETILLCERQQESRLRSLGQVLCTPIGYGTLCSACRIAAEAGSESDPDERVEAEP